MFMQLILTNTAKAFVVNSHNDRNFIIFRGITTKVIRVVLISSIVLLKKFKALIALIYYILIATKYRVIFIY